MNGLPYYKAYPRDFIEGTIGMPFELKGAYRIVLDLIYLQGGALPDDDRYISGALGCSVRAWKKYRAALIAIGKLRAEAGVISNFRADKELETLAKLQDKQRENASGPRKNKGLEKPWPSHTEPEPDIPIANAIGADARRKKSFHDAIWTNGVLFLTERGVTEKQARSFLGRAKKQHGDEAVFNALASAAKAGAVDPIPYITKALQSVARPEAQKLEAWGIPDAQPVRPLPRIADIDTKKPPGAPDLPAVQREQKEERREMLISNDDARGHSDILPPLRAQCGSKA